MSFRHKNLALVSNGGHGSAFLTLFTRKFYLYRNAKRNQNNTSSPLTAGCMYTGYESSCLTVQRVLMTIQRCHSSPLGSSVTFLIAPTGDHSFYFMCRHLKHLTKTTSFSKLFHQVDVQSNLRKKTGTLAACSVLDYVAMN